MKRCVYLLLFLLLTCCQKNNNAEQKHSVRINIGVDPQSLDPRKARILNETTIVRMFFEGLSRISKSGDVELALAKDVAISQDGLEYTFHLRKSQWSNGEPVTSFDFAESWKTILDPQFPTDIASQLYPIKNARKAKLGEIGLDQVGIETPDADTLIVQLEQPVPYFIDLVSMPSFFPVPTKIVNANSEWAFSTDGFVCNGPFMPESWKRSDQIAVIKNPRYWQAKQVHLNRMDLMMISADTELRMFETGNLSWAGSPLTIVPYDALDNLKTEGKLQTKPFCATYFFRVNTADLIGDKKNPLGSPFLRKALAYALNRSEITEHVLQGGQTPAKSLVPPEMGLSEKGYFYDNHPEKARAFLVDALLELDLTLESLEPIKLSYIATNRHAPIVQAVQKQWEKALGIKVELEPLEVKVFFQRLSQKQFQLAACDWTADFNDPINFLEVFKYKSAGVNRTNWENAKYIDLLNQSDLCTDLEERRSLLRQAEQILMEQMPIVPLFHLAQNYLQSDVLQNVSLSSTGQIDFRWAKMSEEKR